MGASHQIWAADSRLTGLELHFADHDPTSVEVESGDDALPDSVPQRHGHVARVLHHVVALQLEADRK